MRFLVVTAFSLLPLVAQTSGGSPASRAFDSTALDRSVSPCQNFYQFACGGWMARNPIPPDRARWGRFDELVERNNAVLREILEKAAVDRPDRTAEERKIGEYYAARMYGAAIERTGT